MIETIQSVAGSLWNWVAVASTFVGQNSGPISVILTILLALFGVEGKARDAIAAINEMKAKMSMTPDEALEKAAIWMGNTKWTGWIPLGVRKWIIQTIFNSMKAAIKAKAK